MAKTRMAGKLMGMLGDFVRPTLANEKGKITPMSVAGRIGPDAFFGALAAAHTPGDAFDKGAAFLGSTVGGSMGGVVLGGIGSRFGMAPNMITELAGGYGGDMVGQMLSDTVSRGKDLAMGGKGQTAWERMGEQQQAQYAAELEKQILAKYGLLVPGSREQYLSDPTTGMGVA